MRKVHSVVTAFAVTLFATAACAAGYSYSTSGAPVFPHFKLHVTTYAQIRAALGPPIKEVGFDANGSPAGAAFIIPGAGTSGVVAWQCVFVFGEHALYNGVTCNPTTITPGSK